MDPNSCIKSDDPSCSPIDKIADITKTANLDKYAINLQTNAIKKQFVYFVTLETTVGFKALKLSRKMYAWLKEQYAWLKEQFQT
jgi:hypothetical protein